MLVQKSMPKLLVRKHKVVNLDSGRIDELDQKNSQGRMSHNSGKNGYDSPTELDMRNSYMKNEVVSSMTRKKKSTSGNNDTSRVSLMPMKRSTTE